MESYYRDADATDLKERYTPVYAGLPARAVQETHYLSIPASGGVGDPYEITKVNIFTYNEGGDRYLQSTFDGDDPGTLESALLYTFADVGPGGSYREKRTRSVLNADGQVMLYRSYAYDPDGYAVGISWFDYAAPDGQELRSRETFSYYQDDDLNYFYEASSYAYDYPAAAASGRAAASSPTPGPSGRDRLNVPAPAHLGE